MNAPRHFTIPLLLGIGFGMLAVALVAEREPVAVLAEDEPTGDATAERVPLNPFQFHHEHRFLLGEAVVTFDVPEDPLPGRVAVWFEGIHASGGATVRILAPQGTVLVESAITHVSASLGGRNNVAQIEGIDFAPGTYRVEFRGGSTAVGHALAESS